MCSSVLVSLVEGAQSTSDPGPFGEKLVQDGGQTNGPEVMGL